MGMSVPDHPHRGDTSNRPGKGKAVLKGVSGSETERSAGMPALPLHVHRRGAGEYRNKLSRRSLLRLFFCIEAPVEQVKEPSVSVPERPKIFFNINPRKGQFRVTVVQHFIHTGYVNTQLVRTDGCHRVPGIIEVQVRNANLTTNPLQANIHHGIKHVGCHIVVTKTENRAISPIFFD